MREHHTAHHTQNSIGMFLTGAVAALLAGGFFLFGSKNAKRNRQNVEWWVEDAKDEVLSNVKKIKNLTRSKFEETIDKVIDKYADFKDATKEKVDGLREELRSRWDEVEKEVNENKT
jgi:hypothetical protein